MVANITHAAREVLTLSRGSGPSGGSRELQALQHCLEAFGSQLPGAHGTGPAA